MVEDGRPFCPHCRAPQVRVLIAPQPAEVDSATPDIQSYPEGVFPAPATHKGEMDRGIATRAAIQAGLLGLLISIIPFLGIVLNDGPEAFERRANAVARYLPDFGIASYCGWGREAPEDVPVLLADLQACCERFTELVPVPR